MTELYNKYLHTGDAEHDKSAPVVLLNKQMKDFWRSIWRSDARHMFQCYPAYLDSRNNTNPANLYKELKAFDFNWCLEVQGDDGSLEVSRDEWRRYVEEFFEVETSKKFGVVVDLVFPEDSSNKPNEMVAFSSSMTVTNPTLFAKLVDPNSGDPSKQAEGAQAQRKEKFEEGDDIAQLLKKKAMSYNARDYIRRVIEEKINPKTMKAPEFPQVAKAQIANDPDVASAVMIVIWPMNAHNAQTAKEACDYASKVFAEVAGLDVEFDYESHANNKPATKAKVVDAQKLYSALHESKKAKHYTKKQLNEAIEYWESKLRRIDEAYSTGAGISQAVMEQAQRACRAQLHASTSLVKH